MKTNKPVFSAEGARALLIGYNEKNEASIEIVEKLSITEKLRLQRNALEAEASQDNKEVRSTADFFDSPAVPINIHQIFDKELGQRLIDNYVKDHGRYPTISELLVFILDDVIGTLEKVGLKTSSLTSV